MKRISHFFIVLIGICTALVLGYIFTVIYTEVGNALLVHDSKTITLYKVLTEINFSSIAVAFGMAFAYMLFLASSSKQEKIEIPVKNCSFLVSLSDDTSYLYFTFSLHYLIAYCTSNDYE